MFDWTEQQLLKISIQNCPLTLLTLFVFFKAWATFVSFTPSVLHPSSTFQIYFTERVCEGWPVEILLLLSAAADFLILGKKKNKRIVI